MQQNDRRTVGGASFGVADVEDAGVDLFHRGERGVRSRLDRRQLSRLAGLRRCWTGHGEPGAGDSHGRGAQKPAAMMIDFLAEVDWLILSIADLPAAAPAS